MTKKEIVHHGQMPLPPDLRQSLLAFFDEPELSKLERLGGRIQLSISAPLPKAKKTSTLPIDDKFVQMLYENQDPVTLRAQLETLSRSQLRTLAGLIKYPIRSKSAAAELRAELATCFLAQDKWNRIASTTHENGE